MTPSARDREMALELTGRCTCDEAYKIRSMKDPRCVYCDIYEETAAALAMARAEGVQSVYDTMKAVETHNCGDRGIRPYPSLVCSLCGPNTAKNIADKARAEEREALDKRASEDIVRDQRQLMQRMIDRAVAEEREAICRRLGHHIPLTLLARGSTDNGDWSVHRCEVCGAVREWGYPFGVETERTAAAIRARAAEEK